MDMQNQEVAAILAGLGLPKLRVVADADDIAALEGNPACRVSFAEALRQAIEAFLRNGAGSTGQGLDSALDVVRSAPESFGLDPNPTEAEISEALRQVLAEDERAEIVLLTPATIKKASYRFLPEYGERIEENWIFRIIAPATWPFLQWSIVDLRGEKAAYSYEFD